MKILSLTLLIILFLGFSTHSQQSIQSAIDQFANDPALKHASISFKVIDLNTGNEIATLDPNRTMPTASTAKLFSTATALDILGPEFRPITKVYHDGEVDSSGVLKGNVWIRGGGDPALGSKYFNKPEAQLAFMNDWVQALKAAGIKSITGDIIADASEFGYEGAPDGWNWVDLGNYYGAGPSGLTLYDNLVRYYFSVSSTAGRIVKVNTIEPKVDGLVFHNYIKSSSRRGDNAYLYGAPYSLDRFGTGTLPVNSSNFLVKGSLPDPEFQFASELFRALKSANISVDGKPMSVRKMNKQSASNHYESYTLLIEHKGERLFNVAKETNMRSVNLFAEHMLTLVGHASNGDGSTKSGIRAMENHWKKYFSIQGMQLNDGSGLSRMNAVSANHFVALLAQMKKSKYASDFVATLPIAGQSGTLRNVCKGQAAQGRMYAKSGSMTRIKSYAGYISSQSGKEFAFALIVNNYTCSLSVLRRKMETVFNRIALQ